jgi:RTX calcium-binding nonapeptide repeat (4 copies)
MKRFRPFLLALLVLVLLAAGAAPAQATLRVVSDGTVGLVVRDKNGLSDNVRVGSGTAGGQVVWVVENNNGGDIFKFEFGINCSQHPSNGAVALCKRLGSTKVNLDMVGGSDRVDVSPSVATFVSANLATGNDTYTGIGGYDNVFAGSGDDNVTTFAGNDDLSMGTGRDTASAGSGNDEIDDSNGSFGSTGDDSFDAGSGDDEISTFASSADTELIGNSGNDSITSGPSNDRIVGVTGVDTVSSSNGNDVIVVKESTVPGTRDTVTCGFGDDDVVADLTDEVDAVNDPGGGTCEEIDRSPVGETPHVRIAARSLNVSPSGRVRVGLRCPRRVRSLGCRGRLQLRIARNPRRGVQARSRRVRYRIGANRRKTVTLRLSRADVRTLRRRQRRGRRTRGILTSVERGRKGRKATVRNPRLRLR